MSAGAQGSRSSDELAGVLSDIVGPAYVVTSPDVLAGRVVDWTGRWHGACRLAVSPRNGAELGQVLAACAGEHVVVQGGNTGLVGGAIPETGDVLLLTERLCALEPPDELAHTVVVGAGVTLAALQQHLEPYGLELPVDIAARDSATVGGMAATNAGGIRVLRDGSMRRQVLSADAYDIEGRQISVLHELTKDNTGYDLTSLLVGSEGTLGVLSRLLLRVVPRVPVGAVVLVGLPDMLAVCAAVSHIRRERADLRAAELVSAEVLGLLSAHLGQPTPVQTPWAVLLQFSSGTADLGALGDAVTAALTDARTPDATVLAAVDARGIRDLWSWRDRVTESIAQEAAASGASTTKLDVALPAAGLPRFVDDLVALMRDRPQRMYLFGHVGDGNLHVNLVGPTSAVVEDHILRLVAASGGSISAEHGIGRAKAPWLELARTEAERTAMRALKAAWDPENRLGRAIW